MRNPIRGVSRRRPRQVGKTSLVQAIRSQRSRKSVYLDLENPDDRVKLGQPSLFLEPLADQTVILDEVQKLPSLFPVLRGIIGRHRACTALPAGWRRIADCRGRREGGGGWIGARSSFERSPVSRSPYPRQSGEGAKSESIPRFPNGQELTDIIVPGFPADYLWSKPEP